MLLAHHVVHICAVGRVTITSCLELPSMHHNTSSLIDMVALLSGTISSAAEQVIDEVDGHYYLGIYMYTYTFTPLLHEEYGVTTRATHTPIELK